MQSQSAPSVGWRCGADHCPRPVQPDRLQRTGLARLTPTARRRRTNLTSRSLVWRPAPIDGHPVDRGVPHRPGHHGLQTRHRDRHRRPQRPGSQAAHPAPARRGSTHTALPADRRDADPANALTQDHGWPESARQQRPRCRAAGRDNPAMASDRVPPPRDHPAALAPAPAARASCVKIRRR